MGRERGWAWRENGSGERMGCGRGWAVGEDGPGERMGRKRMGCGRGWAGEEDGLGKRMGRGVMGEDGPAKRMGHGRGRGWRRKFGEMSTFETKQCLCNEVTFFCFYSDLRS